MPIYEYRCNSCRRKVSLLVRSFSQTPEPVCNNCGSKELTRLFSTFAHLKTDQDVYEDILGDTNLVNRMMANDPSALVEWSRRMDGSEGEKSPEYGEMMERLEKGEGWEGTASDTQDGEFGDSEGSDLED